MFQTLFGVHAPCSTLLDPSSEVLGVDQLYFFERLLGGPLGGGSPLDGLSVGAWSSPTVVTESARAYSSS